MEQTFNNDICKDWQYYVTFGEQPYMITIRAQYVGEDLLVSISGGTHPHIGAVALAHYHPSMKDGISPSASTSLIVITPHKEGELAMKVAEQLAKDSKTNVIVTAGIHIDNATNQDIQLLLNNTQKATEVLKAHLYCTG